MLIHIKRSQLPTILVKHVRDYAALHKKAYMYDGYDDILLGPLDKFRLSLFRDLMRAFEEGEVPRNLLSKGPDSEPLKRLIVQNASFPLLDLAFEVCESYGAEYPANDAGVGPFELADAARSYTYGNKREGLVGIHQLLVTYLMGIDLLEISAYRTN